MFLLVAYDIPDDKRRRGIEKVLGGYGNRVNYSVFEIVEAGHTMKRRMREELLEILDKAEDSVRIYTLDITSAAESEEIGRGPDPFSLEDGHVF
ncbi:CRISPR-associated endonuclease Cas2 [Hydrogenimonas sp.]